MNLTPFAPHDLRPGGNENRILTYDALDRMITAHGPELLGFEYYGYDALDNLRSASFTGSARADLHITWQMNAANRLASIYLTGHSHHYTHDARGNHTSGLSTALVPYTRSFNARNQLTSVNLPGQVDVYRYDGQTHQPSFGPSPAKTRGSSVLLIRAGTLLAPSRWLSTARWATGHQRGAFGLVGAVAAGRGIVQVGTLKGLRGTESDPCRAGVRTQTE